MKQQKLSYLETAYFCRSLACMLHAGLGFADAVLLLSKEQQGDEWLSAMAQELDRGGELSKAMEQSGVFEAYASRLCRIGERTGRLEQVFEHLADYYDERSRSRQMIKNALAYPGLILLLMLAVIAVLLIKVLPVFDSVYASLGSRLSGISGSLLLLGRGLEKALPVLLVLLLLGLMLLLLYSFSAAFRLSVDSFLKKHFGDSGVFRRLNNARFARGLALGLGSGISLEEAVALSSSMLADVPGARKRAEGCAALLEAGHTLDTAMGQSGLLSPGLCSMLNAGMRSGKADSIMAEIADRLYAEAEESMDRSVSRIEPAMVLLCSLLVGGILLAVMLPLINIMSVL